MGKFVPNAQKLAAVTQYFRASRVAHNIKDLEKHLPSVASINGMQVKDYLQALSDENKICVEKIGSGNWYWAFASEDRKTREKALDDARAAHEKAMAGVVELRQKAEEVRVQQDQDERDGGVADREALVKRRAQMEMEVAELKRELEGYADFDPVELQRKKEGVEKLRAEAELFTDEIYAMEGWFRRMGQDEEGMRNLRVAFYGDQLDEEEGVMKEL